MASKKGKNIILEVGSSSGTKRRTVEFKKHIYRVAKKVHPDLDITVESIEMMNDIMNDMLHKIVEEVAKNVAALNQKLLVERDLWVGVKELYPKYLARCANLHAYFRRNFYETHRVGDLMARHAIPDSEAIDERESQRLAKY
ncbi:putative transcription factor Hap3/NF-YB family [Medicago truncatula]|uniref:Putative transcription factor Hap3/NF-YB family n=1 Tax=Medicago truncatula TaxID=3880 RepID=A0A396IG72_MEDTR|nr:putative transcription factor Hap3/NF-YB family [Medicago truncatula]